MTEPKTTQEKLRAWEEKNNPFYPDTMKYTRQDLFEFAEESNKELRDQLAIQEIYNDMLVSEITQLKEVNEHYEKRDLNLLEQIKDLDIEISDLKSKLEVVESKALSDFIAEVKKEFADQNWDYLDFIAERVLTKIKN